MNAEDAEREDYLWLKRMRAKVISSPRRVFFWVGMIALACCSISFLPPIVEYFRSDDPRISLTRLSPPLLGDSFGLLNAIMSTIAVIGLLFTLALQSKEIDDAQEALRVTMEAQEKASQQTLLSTYLSIVSTAISYYSTSEGDDYGSQQEKVLALVEGRLPTKERRRRADELAGELESLMDVLGTHVRKVIPPATPDTLVDEIRDGMLGTLATIKHGQVCNRDTLIDLVPVIERYKRLMHFRDDERADQLRKAADELKDSVMLLVDCVEKWASWSVLVIEELGRSAKPSHPERLKIAKDRVETAREQIHEAERRLEESYNRFQLLKPRDMAIRA